MSGSSSALLQAARLWERRTWNVRLNQIMASAGLAALCSCLTVPAKANWAYTQWGMTPEQVAAASSGAVQVLPSSQRTRNDVLGWEMAAKGTYKDGSLTMDIGFTFDTQHGGLTCVMYNVMGDDATVLRETLGKRYGKPFKEGSSSIDQDVIWHTPDEIEFAALKNPVVAAVTHCQPDKP
jgi:hypothetical protein